MSTRTQIKNKLERRANRQNRVRAKISGTAAVPRLCVSRSNQHISAQLVDDVKGITLAACNDKKIDLKNKSAQGQDKNQLVGKQSLAYEVGAAIAKKAQELKMKKVVFDRSGYRYHGRIKSLAQGARQAGLEF
jgi:large subunit ribosomal protein L18